MQFFWIVQTPKFTKHLYSARHLHTSQQSTIMLNVSHNLHWNHFSSISLLLPMKIQQHFQVENFKSTLP